MAPRSTGSPDDVQDAAQRLRPTGTDHDPAPVSRTFMPAGTSRRSAVFIAPRAGTVFRARCCGHDLERRQVTTLVLIVGISAAVFGELDVDLGPMTWRNRPSRHRADDLLAADKIFIVTWPFVIVLFPSSAHHAEMISIQLRR